jgi:hypothetical protein
MLVLADITHSVRSYSLSACVSRLLSRRATQAHQYGEGHGKRPSRAVVLDAHSREFEYALAAR